MIKVIVFGASGQLGQCLKAVAKETQLQRLVFPDKESADILNVQLLREIFGRERPGYVINCAAYTAVDKAEDEPELAGRINRDGAFNLARLCNEFGSVLIHVSTDFVFAGNSVLPLNEADLAEPVNVYGLTKLEGEAVVAEQTGKYFILRTSWLYSEYGNNFVKTMRRLGSERSSLNVVSDQVGTPTYAIDLAACILHIIEIGSNEYGVYHYSNEGVASWYDFAKAVFELSEMPVEVSPVASQEFITRARRPAFSVMNKAKIKAAMKIEIPYWRESLAKCISNLRNSDPTTKY
ncbi:dTDP-4-dehydrorhamnose reductase [Flavihumibacter sp. R14]|nr:dTDP-4-dehydrorhamnose reductase [Flavihumibacter soli]